MSTLISLKITFKEDVNYLLFGNQICRNLEELAGFCFHRYHDSQKNGEGFVYYWIDDDGDKIHITTDEDYRSFLQAMDNERAHLYVVGKNTNTCDLPIHPCVTCDKCKEVIKGTRYKCLICYNYDICMSCEANFRHKNHLMLRIPRTKMFENYKTEMAGRKLELSLSIV